MSRGKDNFKRISAEMTYAAVTTLSAAFCWKESAEGHAYWEGIAKRLQEIAAIEESKGQTKH